MGKLNYSTTEVNESVRKSIDRAYFIATNPTDNADTLTFIAGEVEVFKLLPASLVTKLANEFVVNTYGSQFKGTGSKPFMFNATAVVGSSVVNTVVHFRLAFNGVSQADTESATKLDSTSSLATIDAASGVMLSTDDVVQIYVKVDKACTISVYHTQIQVVEL